MRFTKKVQRFFASRQEQKEKLQRKLSRALRFETLEDRKVFAVSVTGAASPETIYEDQPTYSLYDVPSVHPGWTTLTYSLTVDGGSTVYPNDSYLEIHVSGQKDAYSLEFSDQSTTHNDEELTFDSGRSTDNLQIYQFSNAYDSTYDFYLSALNDESISIGTDTNDSSNDDVEVEFKLFYKTAPNASTISEASGSTNVTIIDPESAENQVVLSNDDGTAAEPHSTFYLPESPTDSGSVKVTVPEVWAGGYVSLTVSGIGILDTDYSLGVRSVTPSAYQNGVVLNAGTTSGTFVLTIPSGVTEIILGVTPIADSTEAELSETLKVEAGSTSFSLGILASGSGEVTITDEEEGLGINTSGSNVLEYLSEEPFPTFNITPDKSGVLMSGSAYLYIDASGYGAAIPGNDYELFVEANENPLQFTQIIPNIYVTDSFSITNASLRQIKVVPKADKELEGKESIVVELRTGSNHSKPDMSHGTGTIDVTEAYKNAKNEKDINAGCSCSCTTCVSGNSFVIDVQSGSVSMTTAGGLIEIRTEDQNGSNPVVYAGLKLPSGKAVPTSVEVMMQVIEPDVDGNGDLQGLGRKPVASNPVVKSAFNLEVPTNAVPGDTLWFALSADLSEHVLSWTRLSGPAAGSSGITEQLVFLELLAHPNFPSTYNSNPVLTANKFSGWVGWYAHAMQDQQGGSLSEDIAANTHVAGVDRMLVDQKALVADTSSTESAGLVKRESGSLLVRSDGSTTWFKDNAGSSPETQDVLSGAYVTDRYGNRTRFNSLGEMIERIDTAGNKLLYTYNTNGTLEKITDPRGQVTQFTYSTGSGGAPTLLIKTVNNSADDALNRSYLLTWNAFSANTMGSLKVRYDDPDDDGPKSAREDVYTYDKHGLLVSYASGPIGAPTQTTTINNNFTPASGGQSAQGDRRVSSIEYPDGSITSIDFPGLRTALIMSTASGTISANDPRAFRIDTVGNNPIKRYAAITRKHSAFSIPQRTIVELDHYGRVLRSWDPHQVNALGLDTAAMDSTTTIATLTANTDLSYQYTRSATTRDSLGQITGQDYGSILEVLSPDPDKVKVGGSFVNGPKSRQATAMTYSNNNVLSRVPAVGLTESWTWNDTFDLPISGTDVSGNKFFQTIDSSTGLVTSQRWEQRESNEENAPFIVVSQTDYQYTTGTNGLPIGLVTQETIETGRSNGDLVRTYAYFNTPSDKARHGKLQSITEAPGTSIEAVTSFLYDDRGNVSQVTDPAGRVTKMIYDRRDRLIGTLSPDPDGSGDLLPVLVRFDYDVHDNLIATELVNSTLENGELLVTALISNQTYDGGNRVSAEYTQNPNVTWYLYLDGSGNLARTQSKDTALGATKLTSTALTSYANNTAAIVNLPSSNTALQGLVTTYSYFASSSSAGNVVSTTTTDMTAANPSATSRTTSITYDRLDRPIEIVSPGASGQITTTFQYDNLGNTTAVTDGLNKTTSYEHNGLNQLSKVARPNPVMGATLDTTYDYDPAQLGWIIDATDARGNTDYSQFDSLGRIQLVNGATITQEIKYWADGNIRYVADEQQDTTDYNYDARGRLTSVTEPAPSTAATRPVTNYGYSVDGLISSIIDPLNRITSFGYDALGRQTMVIQPDPDGSGPKLPVVTTFKYDAIGNVLESSDSLNETYSYTYDAWFRPITATDPRGAITYTSYDGFGNVTQVTDPNNNQTLYSYNKLGQIVTEDKPVGGVSLIRSYVYDAIGRLTSMTDRNGRVTEYTYDNLHRLTSETWKTGSTENRTISYVYDSVDNLIEVIDSDPLATDFEFSYNTKDQLKLEEQSLGLLGTSAALKREWDLDGNRIQLSANLGGSIVDRDGTLYGTYGGIISGGINDFKTDYTYDKMNRLTQVVQQSVSGGNSVSAKTVAFQYDLASQVTDVRRYDATSANSSNLQLHSRNAYDSAGRLKSITHSGVEIASGEYWTGTSSTPASVSSASMLAGYFLNYDHDNRPSEFASYRDLLTTLYRYDASDQLIGAETLPQLGQGPIPIAIDNPSFESPALSDGQWNDNPITGWSKTGSTGIHNAAASWYTSQPATDGSQVAWSNDGSISQVLDEDLAANTLYTLQVDIGDRIGIAFPGYSIGLYAGGVLLKQVTLADFQVEEGEFTTATFEYTSASSVPSGQALEIRLSGDGGGQTSFDNVRLTKSVAPPYASTQLGITNSSFEEPQLSEGGWTEGSIPGWTRDGTGNGVYNPLPGDYYGIEIVDGEQVAFFNGGILKQVLNEVLKPNTTYWLQADIGDRIPHNSPGFRLELWAGTTMLQRVTHTDFAAQDGKLVTATLLYSSPSSVQSGQHLEIRLSADTPQLNAQINFDNVRLTAVQTPFFTIPIGNHSFEQPMFGNGGWTEAPIPYWTPGSSGNGVYNTLASDYVGEPATHGQQVAYIYESSLKQILNVDLAPNTIYRLQADVGDRLPHDSPGFRLELWAGGNLLKRVTQADFALRDGKFVTATLVYSSPSSVQSSQALEIRLSVDSPAANAQINFDNIRLTARYSASETIPIGNASFEDPAQPSDGQYSSTIHQWTKSGGTNSGVFNPSSSDYTGQQATDGNQVAYIDSGVLSQVLAASLAPNTAYTLRVDVGDRNSIAFPGYSIGLYAGGKLLKEITQADYPGTNAGFVTATLDYLSASSVPADQALEIRLSTLESQTNFDNVRLSAVEAPSNVIPILSPSFETPVAVYDGGSYSTITNWTKSSGSDSGVYNPTSSDYSGQQATHGTQVLYINTGTVSQVLAASLAPSTTYTLTIDIGERTGYPSPGYSVGLYAGGTLLEEITDADFGTENGSFVTGTLSYTSSSNVTVGQALEIRISSSGAQTNFDNVRLVATGTPATSNGEQYNYDFNGNRLSDQGVSQSASGTHNRLQTDDTFNYSYDNEGNVTRRTRISDGTVTDHTWDHRNRMTSVTDKTSATGTVTKKVEFIYDAFDRRVAKRVDADGNSSWDSYDAWILDGQHEVMQLKDSDGQGTAQPFRISNRFLYGDAVDQLLADEQYTDDTGFAVGASASSATGNTLWALSDHLGSVRDVVDNNGVIRQHVVYDSFGNRTDEIDYDASGNVIANNHADAIDELFGYTGRDWDTDVDLQYNRARWYDPATGRWMSQDPIGFGAGDANLYRYVFNRPINAIDPSGLVEELPNIRPLTPAELDALGGEVGINELKRHFPGNGDVYVDKDGNLFYRAKNGVTAPMDERLEDCISNRKQATQGKWKPGAQGRDFRNQRRTRGRGGFVIIPLPTSPPKFPQLPPVAGAAGPIALPMIGQIVGGAIDGQMDGKLSKFIGSGPGEMLDNTIGIAFGSCDAFQNAEQKFMDGITKSDIQMKKYTEEHWVDPNGNFVGGIGYIWHRYIWNPDQYNSSGRPIKPLRIR